MEYQLIKGVRSIRVQHHHILLLSSWPRDILELSGAHSFPTTLHRFPDCFHEVSWSLAVLKLPCQIGRICNSKRTRVKPTGRYIYSMKRAVIPDLTLHDTLRLTPSYRGFWDGFAFGGRFSHHELPTSFNSALPSTAHLLCSSH